MPSSTAIGIIILAVLAVSLVGLVQTNGGFSKLPQLIENGVTEFRNNPPSNDQPPTTPNSNITPPPGSRFNQGTCEMDSGCFIGGCSQEICGSDPNIVSTCEYSDTFPNERTHSCGCISGTCAWAPR